MSLLVLPLVVAGCTSAPSAVEPSAGTHSALGKNDSGTALVTTGRTPLYAEADKTSTLLRTLASGTGVTSLGESRDGLLHIDVAGDQGWAPSGSLSVVADDLSGAPGGGTATGDGSAADLCVSTINDFRAQNGLPPLTRWTDQEDCASSEAQSDSSTGQFHGAFPSCSEVAQNECPGFPGDPSDALPQCLQTMLDEGPGGGHYDNIMNPDYTMVSCGIITADDGTMWSVQDFR